MPSEPSDPLSPPDERLRAIEAILMVADQPVDPTLLAQLVELPVGRVEELCKELAASYEVDSRGFILARVAGGWRFQSHPDLAAYVERFVLDGVMRTLDQRGYIAEIGRDPGPGQAVLFGTTSFFLEKLALDSLDDLPSLSDFVPGPEVVEALEHGLRPDREGSARGAEGAVDRPAGPRPEPSTAGPAPEVAGDEDPVADDPLVRLDETTARLDALVEQVKSRLEATEAALHDGDEVDEGDGVGAGREAELGEPGPSAADQTPSEG
jgi:segregation and condensation protein B